MAADKFHDLTARGQASQSSEPAAFQRRLIASSCRIRASSAPASVLRLRLWDHLAKALDFEESLPLSTRYANARAAELAHRAASALWSRLKPDAASHSRSLHGKAWKILTEMFAKDDPDFSTVVVARAQQITEEVIAAMRDGTLAPEDEAELYRRARALIEDVPAELRDAAMEDVLKRGSVATIGLLVSGTSLAGVGIAVQLAGFGAYILAAQASAFLPFIGGQTAVLSYDEGGSRSMREPLLATPFMAGSGGERIGGVLVVADRS